MKASPYLKLERRIATGERGGIIDRWRYGRQLLDAKAGRKQLPHGMIAALIKAAAKRGMSLSEREIQRRIKCAETYETEAEVRQLLADFSTWFDLSEAGFPPVQITLDDLEAEGLGDAPDSWEQLQFDIPGLKAEITVGGRKVRLVKGEDGATVADVAAYVDVCQQMHESFGKTVEQMKESLRAMREGAEDNAVEAYERAVDPDDDE